MWHLTACKISVSLLFLNWIKNGMIFYGFSELMLATLIQGNDKKSFHFKNERLNEILHFFICIQHGFLANIFFFFFFTKPNNSVIKRLWCAVGTHQKNLIEAFLPETSVEQGCVCFIAKQEKIFIWAPPLIYS